MKKGFLCFFFILIVILIVLTVFSLYKACHVVGTDCETTRVKDSIVVTHVHVKDTIVLQQKVKQTSFKIKEKCRLVTNCCCANKDSCCIK